MNSTKRMTNRRMEISSILHRNLSPQMPSFPFSKLVVLKQDQRHLRRTRLLDRDTAFFSLLLDSVAEPLSHSLHVFGSVEFLELFEGGEAGGESEGFTPEGTGHVDLCGTFAELVVARDETQSVAVGDRFAPCREIRLDADEFPGSAQVEAHACADVVDNQGSAGLVADGSAAFGKFHRGHDVFFSEVVLERAGNDYIDDI